jgi:hypothetical protein
MIYSMLPDFAHVFDENAVPAHANTMVKEK